MRIGPVNTNDSGEGLAVEPLLRVALASRQTAQNNEVGYPERQSHKIVDLPRQL